MNAKIKSDSLEKFMRKMEKIRRITMTKEQARFFKSMLISSKEGRDVNQLFSELSKDSKSMTALSNRIKALLTIDIELEVQLYIFLQSEAKLTTMILYAYYVQYWSFINNLKKVSMKTFSRRIFPDGFPPNHKINELFNEQIMADGTNLIDYPESSASFQYA